MEELRAFFNSGRGEVKSNGDIKNFIRDLKKVLEKYNLHLFSDEDIVIRNKTGEIILANLGKFVSSKTL